MIALTFTTKTAVINMSAVPNEWRNNIDVQPILSLQQPMRFRYIMQIQPDDSSYRYRALMQKPQLVLKFSLPFYVEFPVGTYMTWQNQRFTLMRAQDLKKQGTRKIEYTMTLGTNEDYFGMWKLRNVVDAVEQGEDAPKDNRLKFALCAKPHEFIDLIVRNLNKKDTSVTWERGECIEASEKTVEFNHSYIDAALSDIANTFNTEYEVEYYGTTNVHARIHLRRVEYNNNTEEAVKLAYGVGNGFVPGVGRTSEADGVPVKRMFTQGTDRNIDRSKYGSPELLMPKSQSIWFDGTNFYNDGDENIPASARRYTTDAAGESVERTEPTVSDATKEDSLDCSEIYPSRIGVVTDVRAVNPDKNFYDIVDRTIPDNLNFNDYLIAGETMTLIMQDGMLAGKEFDVKYIHTEVVNGTRVYAKRFEIVPQEIDGVMMPNATFCPVANDDPDKRQKYAVFGIQLPEEYICNNENKTGASWDMMRAAVRELYKAEDQRFTFTGSLQALYAKRNWLDIGGKLIVGGHVLFKDNQFAKDGVLIRIVGIKDYLTAPYAPTIELSNSVSAGGASVSSQLRQIENTEVIIEEAKKTAIQYTKRRFRDAKETVEMLEDALLDGFANSISPVAVQTMSLLVGDESLQFQFVGEDGNGNEVIRQDAIGFNNNTKQLNFVPNSAGMRIYLKHYTIGIDAISSTRDDSKYRRWEIAEYHSPVLAESDKRYYVYARCAKDNNEGNIVLSETAIRMEQEVGNYHFLVGFINSEQDGERSFVTLFGFTEILPGRITTDRIVSSNGDSWFDLARNEMQLGDCLRYANDTLYLKFLFSENADIGGWIFHDNKLISHKGKVASAEVDFDDVQSDTEFLPNVSLDGERGVIRQGNNLIIDENGFSVLNDNGDVTALITNATIGNVDEVADAADTVLARLSKSTNLYIPYTNSSYTVNIVFDRISIGTLTAGSNINIVGGQLSFMIPHRSSPPQFGWTQEYWCRCAFQLVRVYLYKGNSLVCQLTSTAKTQSYYSGDYVTLPIDAGSAKTIGEDGDYYIQVELRLDFSAQHSGIFDNINFNSTTNTVRYSYAKSGYKRTVIGNDGFYTSWESNQYMYANKNCVALRHGNNIIKISSAGLQKSTDGGHSWSNL